MKPIFRRTTIFKLVFLAVIFLLAFTAVRVFDVMNVYREGAVDEIIKEANTAGGILLFLALYAIRPIFVILPASPMAFAGGAIYGRLFGTLIVVTGALISGTFGFFLTRFIGKEYFDRITMHRISRVKSRLEEGSWATVIVLNFIGLPWDLVSIAAGLSKIRYRDFFIGIFVASIPQSLIAVYIGHAIFSIKSAADLLRPGNFVILFVVILGITLPHYIKRRMYVEEREKERR